MCTRVVYLGENNTVITGRNLDWGDDMRTNIWVMPRGVERDGLAGPNSLKWKSKYGSVISTAYDIGAADGMNEKNLVANVLWLAEADFGKPDGRPTMSLSIWLQYVLDNFASVNEAVGALSLDAFQILPFTLPNGRFTTVHLAISDASGDSAIFEYLNGKLVIHHGREYQVMTNSPTYDEQLALNNYWKALGFQKFLPGTISAADRFARAYAFVSEVPTQADRRYISAVPNSDFHNQALSSVRGIMRAVSVPLGVAFDSQPNLSSTIWTTVFDHKKSVMYFDSQTSPNTFWVDFNELDFSEGAPVKKLTVAGGMIYAGDMAKQFEASNPIAFFAVPA